MAAQRRRVALPQPKNASNRKLFSAIRTAPLEPKKRHPGIETAAPPMSAETASDPSAALALPQPIGLVRLSLLAVAVGIVTGVGAVAFRALIAFVHNLLFLGTASAAYDSNAFTPPHPWGAAVILVPVVGGLFVTLLVTKFAPEAQGHGVPEVMDAIYYREGRIRPAVAVVKSLASAISIGSGASVGREGPIIQIGASLG